MNLSFTVLVVWKMCRFFFKCTPKWREKTFPTSPLAHCVCSRLRRAVFTFCGRLFFFCIITNTTTNRRRRGTVVSRSMCAPLICTAPHFPTRGHCHDRGLSLAFPVLFLFLLFFLSTACCKYIFQSITLFYAIAYAPNGWSTKKLEKLCATISH